MSGIPLKVFAAPFKGTAPNAAIALALEIDVRTLDFVEGNGTFNEQIEVAYTATNTTGKVFPGERQTATLTLKPDTYERAKARGFRVLSQANLPPGRYQMRVAAGNKAGKAGSVVYDLEVPDFNKDSLMMSGVAFTSAAAAQAPTVKPKDPLADFLPGPITAMREFEKGDLLVLFAEFYENVRSAAAHMLDFKAELRAEGGRVVQAVNDERSSTELQGKSGGLRLPGASATRRRGIRTLRRFTSKDAHAPIRTPSSAATFRSGCVERDSRSSPHLMRLDLIQTVAFAGLMLFVGYGLKRMVPVLARYNIPAPVVGGLPVAALFALLHAMEWPAPTFDTTLQTPLQNTFFASIGFGASVLVLKRGGPLVAIMMVVASVAAVLQNVVGGVTALALGQHPLMGVLAGSTTLTGGPATGLAFAPLFEAGGRDWRGNARSVCSNGGNRRRRSDRWSGRDVLYYNGGRD